MVSELIELLKQLGIIYRGFVKFLYLTYFFTIIMSNLVEELPDGIAKRVKILNPNYCPQANCGALVFDFDEEGKLVESYFEGLKNNRVYTLKSKVYSYDIYKQ